MDKETMYMVNKYGRVKACEFIVSEKGKIFNRLYEISAEEYAEIRGGCWIGDRLDDNRFRVG